MNGFLFFALLGGASAGLTVGLLPFTIARGRNHPTAAKFALVVCVLAGTAFGLVLAAPVGIVLTIGILFLKNPARTVHPPSDSELGGTPYGPATPGFSGGHILAIVVGVCLLLVAVFCLVNGAAASAATGNDGAFIIGLGLAIPFFLLALVLFRWSWRRRR